MDEPAQPPNPPRFVCRKCGAAMDPHERFCPNCGEPATPSRNSPWLAVLGVVLALIVGGGIAYAITGGGGTTTSTTTVTERVTSPTPTVDHNITVTVDRTVTAPAQPTATVPATTSPGATSGASTG